MESTKLISSQGGSPANHLATLANEPEQLTIDIFGLKCSESSEKSNPLGLLLKMLRGSSVWRSQIGSLSWKTKQLYAKRRRWCSKQSGKTLKKQDTNPSQLLYRLQLSVPRIEDTGSSLWPTVTATAGDGRSEQDPEVWKARYDRTLAEKGIRNGLPINVAVKMWPTPRANDAEKRGDVSDDPRNGLPGAVKLWPTPQAHDAKPGSADRVGRFGSKHGGRNLNDYVMLWPTPTTNDAKNATLPPAAKDWDIIPGALMREGYTSQEGQLNPEWVEVLMNFPLGWTDVE